MSIETRLKAACLNTNRASGLLGLQIVKKRLRRDEIERVQGYLKLALEEVQTVIAEAGGER